MNIKRISTDSSKWVKKTVISLSKIKTDGRDWHTCLQIWACLTFNLLWMADPRWWWDSGAQVDIQHPFSFYSNVLCQLQLFYLVDDANITKKKETIMKTGSLTYWKWDVGQFIKASPNIHMHPPSLISGLVSYSSFTQMVGWWNKNSKDKQQTHQAGECHYIPLTTEPKMGRFVPLALS